ILKTVDKRQRDDHDSHTDNGCSYGKSNNETGKGFLSIGREGFIKSKSASYKRRYVHNKKL
ncbi:MAG TPA: hypothetical protein VFQ73_14910, partial [Flavisolibacter sp.]|nr:hypothetical protein [Flavisolibacter sp.]